MEIALLIFIQNQISLGPNHSTLLKATRPKALAWIFGNDWLFTQKIA